MPALAGKVALVTGGASGIGLAVARAFAAAGARVVVADVARDRLDAVVADLRKQGAEALGVPCDVTREADVSATVTQALSAFGRLDCAANNAGVEGAFAKAGDYALAEWQRVLDINLTGVFLCMRHEIPAMLATGGGAIVNTSSILGHVGLVNSPAYVASKHGILGLTKAAALDYAKQGIRVNAVCPGYTETPLLMERGLALGSDPAQYAKHSGKQPMHRMGKPEEVARAVVWLCSADASFTTGSCIDVDGGYGAR